MALCPICGEELVVATVETLKCDHEAKHALGEPRVGSAALECPLKSGAIWVYVTDDAGTGVKGIPVTVTGPKDTDGAGFSSFDPLAAGGYTVKIQVPEALEDQFHPPSKTTVNGVNAQVILFSPGSRTLPPSLPLGELQGAITDARVLATAHGYWLFTLSRVPGVGGDATPRRTVSGSQMPGVLHVTRLGEDMKPLGKSAMILAARPVYEFDVDTAPGNEVAVLATSPAGLIYVRSTLAEVPVHEKYVLELPFERPLSSPSLAMHDGKPFCAAVANMGTADAQVLRGEIP